MADAGGIEVLESSSSCQLRLPEKFENFPVSDQVFEIFVQLNILKITFLNYYLYNKSII